MIAMSCSENGPAFIKSNAEPPPKYSIIIHNLEPWKKIIICINLHKKQIIQQGTMSTNHEISVIYVFIFFIQSTKSIVVSVIFAEKYYITDFCKSIKICDFFFEGIRLVLVF